MTTPGAGPPPRRPGTPLGERPTSGGGVGEPVRPAGVRVVAPGRRHVWVAPVDDAGSSSPHPGLLHAWRRGDDGEWQAHVTYVVDDGSAEGVMVTQWVPAALVRPATGPGPTT